MSAKRRQSLTIGSAEVKIAKCSWNGVSIRCRSTLLSGFVNGYGIESTRTSIYGICIYTYTVTSISVFSEVVEDDVTDVGIQNQVLVPSCSCSMSLNFGGAARQCDLGG